MTAKVKRFEKAPKPAPVKTARGAGKPALSSAELLGRQIRDLRVARGLNLTELSQAIDKSVGYVSQIERGQSEVSISTLKAISDTLGVQIGWFFQGLEPANRDEMGIIVRREQRRQLQFPGTGIDEALLSPNLQGEAELILSTFAPGAQSGEKPVSRPAEQSGYILSGTLELSVGQKHFTLREGDSFRIERGEWFSVKNIGQVSSTSLWVITPPRY
jgi:transcriptional regulator with XRE-family HTH domain